MCALGDTQMSEMLGNSVEGEAQVNPYSLLEAVNRSSDTAHTAWLIFLGIMTYLMIAVAGVTHRDLLLETPVSLPILQVEIQQRQFFQFAPIVLVLFHLGLVSQLVLLARKTLEFDHAIRLLETSDKRTHPLRLELHNFFFVQAIAGPHRAPVMGGFLHAMSWLTLAVLPVILILYIQVVFLPYHNIGITWTHRLSLVVDILMLSIIGVFLVRAETSFFSALFRTSMANPLRSVLSLVIFGAVWVFSFFVATVPGEFMDKIGRTFFMSPAEDTSQADIGGFSLPFVSASSDGALFGIFRRNLVVTDTDLVVDRDVTPGETTLNLRGRDLRYARLDRSDMHQVDLTGANLDYASLDGTDLRGAWLQCADLNELLLSEDRKKALCTSARRADFSRAKLGNAHLNGINASGAKFEEAQLQRANLAYAVLIGANFSSARLEMADLTGGIQAQGANFLIATLQGTDLTGAKLVAADFSSASMQGALLNYAQLQGASLRDADLEAASLLRAKLQGAEMSGAKIKGADLRSASVWMTGPPQQDDEGLADLARIKMEPLGAADVDSLAGQIDRVKNKALNRQMRDTLKGIMDVAGSDAWSNSDGHQAWQSMISKSGVSPAPAPRPVAETPAEGEEELAGAPPAPAPVEVASYGDRLTDHLVKVMCRPRWSNGAVATGIARRAQSQHFRGDLSEIYQRLQSSSCAASKAVPVDIMRQLASAADLSRTQ